MVGVKTLSQIKSREMGDPNKGKPAVTVKPMPK
jgi:hypothetical protein